MSEPILTTPSLTVKDLDPEDQPRERAERLGVGALTTADLWAIVLRTGLPGTPITTLTRNLMKRAGSMHQLERLDRKQLMETPGIGLVKAIQIQAVMELIKRFNIEKLGAKPLIRSSKDLADVISPHIANLDHEEIWCIFLNRKNEVESVEQFTTGSAVASLFDVKAIVRQALLRRSESIVLCHNHPSGNLIPSPQDDNITRTLKNACKLFDIRLVDHVIVTAQGYYSYYDSSSLLP